MVDCLGRQIIQRQVDLIAALAKGAPLKVAAAACGYSYGSAKVVIGELRERFHCSTTAQLVAVYTEMRCLRQEKA